MPVKAVQNKSKIGNQTDTKGTVRLRPWIAKANRGGQYWTQRKQIKKIGIFYVSPREVTLYIGFQGVFTGNKKIQSACKSFKEELIKKKANRTVPKCTRKRFSPKMNIASKSFSSLSSSMTSSALKSCKEKLQNSSSYQ